MTRNMTLAVFTLLALTVAVARSQSADTSAPFAPLDQWKNAVIAGDTEGLKMLFSASPTPKVSVGKEASDVATEVSFWKGLKVGQITLDVIQNQQPQPGVQVVVFQAEVHKSVPKDETLYVTEGQAWQQQSDQWRLVMVSRTEPAHLKQPTKTKKNLYPQDVDAHAEIKEAEEKGAKERKRVLLVFGANWCFDCHVLDLAFQRPEFLTVISRFEVVHVDIGTDGKKNADIAKLFQVPIEKGIPALAVVDGAGKLLVSQKNGEFENARAMTPAAILEFLNTWAPAAQ